METLKLSETATIVAARSAENVLRDGGVVLYPTDTLYGLGVDALNDRAVDKIYQIKKRDVKSPLPVIVTDMQMAKKYGDYNDLAQRLAQKFLPGPLMLVLKKNPSLSGGVARDTRTIGIRIAKSDFCVEMLKHFGAPITATSANKSGAPVQSTVSEILKQLGPWADLIDLVIDGGELMEKKPSTVVDVSNDELNIVREGAILSKTIIEALT